MNRLTRNLYVGAYSEAPKDQAVFCVASEIEGQRVALIDGPGNSAQSVEYAVRILDEWLQDSAPAIYLCCAAGVSRAPYLAALWLTWYLDWNFNDALAWIKTKHPPVSINPAHLEQASEILARLRGV